MKLSAFIILSALLAIILWGCSKDSPSGPSTPPPTASFDMTGGSVTPDTVTFVNTSSNADRYEWDFGDGRTSSQANPVMIFTTHGNYTVSLTAVQTSTNRSATTTRVRNVIPGVFFLDSIVVEQIPFTDPQGAGWDLASGPDLFYDLKRGSTLITSSDYYSDLAPANLPVDWYYQSGLRISDWSTTHTIELYDYDAGSANDFIGTVNFTVNGIAGQGAYPTRVTLRNSAQTVRVVLVVRWQ